MHGNIESLVLRRKSNIFSRKYPHWDSLVHHDWVASVIYFMIHYCHEIPMSDALSKRQRLRQQGTLNARSERVLADLFRDSSFYDPDDLLQVRYEAVRAARQGRSSRAETARDHGLSRHTLHRLERRFVEQGLAGLVPRKRGPRGSHKISDEILRFVDEQRASRGRLGATVLVREIEERFGVSIHRVSLDQALARRTKKSLPQDRH